MCWENATWEQSVSAELFDGYETPFIALMAVKTFFELGFVPRLVERTATTQSTNFIRISSFLTFDVTKSENEVSTPHGSVAVDYSTWH